MNIEVEEEAQAVVAAESAKSATIDLILEVDSSTIEPTVDEEDTDEQIDSTVPEHWEDTDAEAA